MSSRPCRSVKRPENCPVSNSENDLRPQEDNKSEISGTVYEDEVHSFSDVSDVDQRKLNEEYSNGEIETNSTNDNQSADDTSLKIKVESTSNASGSHESFIENPVESDEGKFSTIQEENQSNRSKSSFETELKASIKPEGTENDSLDGYFLETKIESLSLLTLRSEIEEATGSNDKLSLEERAANLRVDDLEYIKEAVGPAIKKALAAVALHHPADPINYFANFLLNYRHNQQMFQKRENDLKSFMELRDKLKKETESTKKKI